MGDDEDGSEGKNMAAWDQMLQLPSASPEVRAKVLACFVPWFMNENETQNIFYH